MNSSLNAKILENPHYQELLRQRRRYAAQQLRLMLCVHLGFIALTVHGGNFLALPLAGNVATTGMLAGAGVIVFSVWIAWRYILQARTRDARIAAIVRELKPPKPLKPTCPR
ncbi:MAG: DUF485 domain-containing protein [Zoogloeaceae bacterium]|jgi:uncharacterized membrane protein (DUF485 family)|nr:DUF485 domain-containing protein [Zoogloeaceae bacterium]